MTEDQAKELPVRVEQTIQDAIAFGDASPEPEIAHLTDDVYSEEPAVLADPDHVLPAWISEKFGPNTPINPEPGQRMLSYSEALREAMALALAYDRQAYLIGEDIGVYGGAFQVTQGLIDEFGPERVRDTPVTEAAIAGAAVGSAVTGMRPIAEMQFMDFLTLAMEQLVLQGAKIRYMFGGKAQVPMVLRLPAGSGTGAAAQHSESLESWLINVPGLKVVAPSTPYDAKGLLLAAIADNNPVMFVENKLLYKVKGPVPEEPYIVPLGRAAVRRAGKDATIVATSIMVPRSLEAAEKLAQEGIDLEVIDLRSLKPYDSETIIASVKKTGRLADGPRGAADRRLRRRDRRHDRAKPGVRLPGSAHHAPRRRGCAHPVQPEARKSRGPAGREHRRGRTAAGEQPDLVERRAWCVVR